MKKKVITVLMSMLCLGISAQTRSWKDVDYVGDKMEGHKMDIYLSDAQDAKNKVVVIIYGSAWFANNAKGMAYQSIGKPLNDAGFAVVSINHRASTEARFPAQINDVKAAIRFIRDNAEKYGLDTSFIGITGFSSGGHLASLAGASNGVKTKGDGNVEVDIEGDLGDCTSQSSGVDAVVDWFGPIDMSRMEKCSTYKDAKSPEAVLLGGPSAERKELCRLMNPMEYITQDTPAFLVIHGDADTVVPHCQSDFFAAALKKKGVLYDFITVKDGQHGPVTFNADTFKAMTDFFKKQSEK